MRSTMAVPLLLAMLHAVCAAQADCFGSVSAAIARRGAAANSGFRLETMLQDPLGGRVWAKLERCEHPDWPALLVELPGNEAPAAAKGKTIAAAAIARASARTSVPVSAEMLVIRAGDRVTVAESSELVRLEGQGVALTSARAGETVKVRIGSGDAGVSQIAVGIARRAGWVELESRVEQER